MTTPERNLVLVYTRGLQARSDFEGVKARLAERAPDIEVFVVDNNAPQSVTRRQAGRRPSLVFSPIELQRFRPLRGKVYAAKHLTKWEEYRRLLAAGLPVPETVMLEPGTRLDPETWGPFTVLKPNIGRQGSGVRLVRTRDVRWRDPFSWPANDPRRGRQMLAQRFIDTGPAATSFRVMTVFGRVIYSSRSWVGGVTPFDRDPAGVAPLDLPVASNAGERHVQLNDREDILALGRRVAAGLPDIASLGIDIICEERTGALYVLEVNTLGRTWHTSSDYGLNLQKTHGVDYANQFRALDVIADALIEATRREAE